VELKRLEHKGVGNGTAAEKDAHPGQAPAQSPPHGSAQNQAQHGDVAAAGVSSPTTVQVALTREEEVKSACSYLNQLAKSLLAIANRVQGTITAVRYAEWKRVVAAVKIDGKEVVPNQSLREEAMRLLSKRCLVAEVMEMIFTLENVTPIHLQSAVVACALPNTVQVFARPLFAGGRSVALQVALGESWWLNQDEANAVDCKSELSDIRVRLALLDTVSDVLKQPAPVSPDSTQESTSS
jgi:hypothetical protein